MEQDELQLKYLEQYYDVLKKVWLPINEDKRYKSKLKGALAAGVIREAIKDVLKQEKLEADYDVSENNVYIYGNATECDLLIIRKDAKPQYASLVYNPEDVVAIIECKSTGIWPSSDSSKNPLRHLIKLYECVNQKSIENPRIKFGYLTFSERINKRKNRLKYIKYVQDSFENCMSVEQRERCVFCFSTDPDNLISDVKNSAASLFEDNKQTFRDFVLGLLPSAD